MTEEVLELNPFKKAEYTAVLSDLHLCESQEIDPKNPLWKKFKTREFFFDQTFSDFLVFLDKQAQGKSVELVLNGDIFDFDSFMRLPTLPPYRISWLERLRGLYPQETKSVFKIKEILKEHAVWVGALRSFVKSGHRIVFVIGNHDLEVHFAGVQKEIRRAMDLSSLENERVVFANWFYISNSDTLIEHGNQYDPYCLCQDPVNPFVEKFNKIEVRLPFGNLASRYMVNGMGFFNPHVDANYIMSIAEYLRFFFKYMIWTQPLIVYTWFWGAVVTLFQAVADRLLPERKDPLKIEDQIEEIAKNSNATPRMVRELKELMAFPAASNPVLLARELWLDRAFIMLLGFFAIYQIFAFIKLVYDISFFWGFVPLFLLVPFFIFYTKSISSSVTKYKEPNESILYLSSRITGTKRVVYGHTHMYRHEMIGSVEHLNSGCWSPAFLDVECTKPFGKKTYVWIHPGARDQREAQLLEFSGGESVELFRRAKRQKNVSAAKKAATTA